MSLLSSGANVIRSEMSALYLPWTEKRTPGRVLVDTANRTFCHLWKRMRERVPLPSFALHVVVRRRVAQWSLLND